VNLEVPQNLALMLATIPPLETGMIFLGGLFVGAWFEAIVARKELRVMSDLGARRERIRVRVFIKSRVEELRRLKGVASPLVGECLRAELAALETDLLWAHHVHEEHGRPGGVEPSDVDCPCLGKHPEEECATFGCSLCGAARRSGS
jgi:hypothetical protein